MDTILLVSVGCGVGVAYSGINIFPFFAAQYHGRVAALNMCDKKTELRVVPYFWTTLFGKSFRYSGHGKPKDIRIEGSLDEMKFVAFFFDDKDKVNGVASCNWDPIVSQYAEHVSAGHTLTRKDLEADVFAWSK